MLQYAFQNLYYNLETIEALPPQNSLPLYALVTGRYYYTLVSITYDQSHSFSLMMFLDQTCFFKLLVKNDIPIFIISFVLINKLSLDQKTWHQKFWLVVFGVLL